MTNLANECNGKFARLSTFGIKEEIDNVPLCINVIRKRCIDLIGDCLIEPYHKDFYIEVQSGGNINQHTDTEYPNYRHIRCNILIQKPEIGGVIVENNKQIDMEDGDMFILKTWINHEITEIKGNKSYKSIVFGFLVPVENWVKV
jgi:hypothetical protein